jgi:hypothetical protein
VHEWIRSKILPVALAGSGNFSDSAAVSLGLSYNAYLQGEGNCTLTIEEYQRDVKVRVQDRKVFRKGGGKREAVSSFSEDSRRRFKFLLRNTESFWKVWIDLTYPGVPTCGREIKRHLKNFRWHLKVYGVKAVAWRLEFQERGSPHYHLLVDAERVHHKWIAEEWDRIIGNDWEARGESHSASTSVGRIQSIGQLYYRVSNYMTKKNAQSVVPPGFEDVGRFWGATRGLLQKVSVRQKVGGLYTLCALTRIMRKWYVARWRSFGRRWRYRGGSFTMYDGSLFMRALRV